MVRRSTGIGSLFFAAALLLGVASANAQADVMKACGAEWQALKAANKVKPGQTWQAFLVDCRKAKAAADEDATPPEPTKPAAAAPAAAKPAAPAAAATKPTAPAAAPPSAAPAAVPPTASAPASADEKPSTPGQLAARERIKKCGAEWTTAKDAGKIPADQKWPQYWSACNKRLKAAGQ